jgi:hypothetical protein
MFCLILLFPLFLAADLTDDLELCDRIDRSLARHVTPYYNFTLQGGYLNMPSARMGVEGEIGAGYSSVPPYRNWNVRVQLFENLEVTANYRIFNGILDPVFGHMGFGEFSDKGANLKFALLRPEDSDYSLPGIAIGFDDFLGTCSFTSKYIVATQVFERFNAELSIGYGVDRIDKWFGGGSWMPFGHWSCSPLRDICLTCEYDAIDYKNSEAEPHPDGRSQSSKWNFGAKYRMWDLIDFTAAYIRGEEYAFALSAGYNFGYSKGFVPKIDDPAPYCFPRNTEPVGYLRPEQVASAELCCALSEQGFSVLKASLEFDECGGDILRIHVINCKWLFERQVRCRLNQILAHLTPNNIDEVRVVMESQGFAIDEFRFYGCFLRMYNECRLSDVELNLLTPRCNVSYPDPCRTRRLFSKNRSLFDFSISPKVHSFFGSTSGKFKYALGVSVGACGYLPWDIYYQTQLSYIAASSLGNVLGVDYLNPSQIINVHTDIVCYYSQRTVTVDQLYLQKSMNIKGGLYGRVAAGYFAQNYGGGALEFLFYPADQPWAIGVEASLLGKRTLTGLGFTNEIRKFVGLMPTYVPFTGYQYYLDLYYDFKDLQLDVRVSAGKFMAHDNGVRTLVERYFDNGMRLVAWYTWTDGNDIVNGSPYHDKGVGFSLPLDFFYTHSCKKRWNYAMSAWLRDVGYRAPTGHRLYDMIHSERID